MSNTTICNHCTLKQITKQVKAAGKEIYLDHHKEGILRVWIYALPPNANFAKMTHRERRENFVAALMELSETCACSKEGT